MTGFEVQAVVAAPRERVWSALTEPAEVRQWFGWEHPGLDEEIRYIFVDHAQAVPPDRIVLAAGQEIQVVDDGGRTVVRVTMPGESGEAYDVLAEGWRLFFAQLRFWLEQAPAGDRHTVRLSGVAAGPGLLAALESAGVKEHWHGSRYLRMAVDTDGLLVAVTAERPLTDEESGPAALVVSGYGRDLAAVRAGWVARWRATVGDEPVVE
ncbi:SRPBCC domain-containing protein [Micromonospora coxensis]|uniref:SRPBCC family protein n=1 Tax=Micromonospora coxensis TaxID=356852 RepID=UPI00342CB9C7